MKDIALPYFTARPEGEDPGPGLVVVHEGNGISSQLLRVCQRLARERYITVAPDLFFRAGGTESGDAGTLMGSLSREQTTADIETSIGLLRSAGATAVGVIGFCMGALVAYRAAVSSPGCDVTVGFYGARIAAESEEPRNPTLLFFGGTDEYISAADIEAVVARHPGTVVYPGAGHGFMRDGSDSYNEEAASDGWRRMLDFLAAHLGSPARPGGL
jgi:carboxymethylenebutenolidase